MDGNYHVNEKENNSPSERRGRTISDVRGPLNGQLSIGQRVLATRKDVGIGRNSPSTTKRKQINGWQNKQVSLKDGNGLVVGKGILLSEVQTGDNVAGLILFPHQVAIRIQEVCGSGYEQHNDDGQLLQDCIEQTVRWSRTAVHVIDNVALSTAWNTGMAEEFNFSEGMLCMNRNRFDKRHESLHEPVGGEESSIQSNGEEVTTCAKFSVFGVDGLAPNIPKRKYSTTKRIGNNRGERKIGSSRAQKVSLASVEEDLKSSLCSRECLKKLNVGAILMKRFKAWGSSQYEERASWILENLTEYYNEETDKFETKLCGQSVCNGCYAVGLGYSKRRIEELKSNIRSTGIISEVFNVPCRGGHLQCMEIEFVFQEQGWVCRQWRAYFRNMFRNLVVLNRIDNVNDGVTKQWYHWYYYQ